MSSIPITIYNNYCKVYPKLNSIFGENNWYVLKDIDQAIIYSMYFNIEIPSVFNILHASIYALSNQKAPFNYPTNYLHVWFKDTPTFQSFLDKNPKIDKTKNIQIVLNDTENTKINIIARIKTNFDSESLVVLNNLNVVKVNMILCSLNLNIKKEKYKSDDELNYLTTMYTVFLNIILYIKKFKEMKEMNKQKLLKQIDKLEELDQTKVFSSDAELEKYKIQTESNTSEQSETPDEPLAKKIKQDPDN